MGNVKLDTMEILQEKPIHSHTMENLQNIPVANINPTKLKKQIKKQLNESIINGKLHENKVQRDKAEKVEKSDEVAEIICKFECTITNI